MNPRVNAVVATDEYQLRMRFTNGEVGVFDCSHLLRLGVFQGFQDLAYLKRASLAHGAVAWPNAQDICPGTFYEDSIRLTMRPDVRSSALLRVSDGNQRYRGPFACDRRRWFRSVAAFSHRAQNRNTIWLTVRRCVSFSFHAVP